MMNDLELEIQETDKNKKLLSYFQHAIGNCVIADNYLFLLMEEMIAYHDLEEREVPVGIYYIIEFTYPTCEVFTPKLDMIDKIDEIPSELPENYIEKHVRSIELNIADLPEFLNSEFGRGWFGDTTELENILES